MKSHESREDYLEAILILSQKLPMVRSVDVANYMEFSKPSVSRAVGLLKEAELICVDPSGALLLTQKGLERAKKIYERHTILTSFLISIGVSEQTAADDACKIEHHISDESLAAIKKSLNK